MGCVTSFLILAHVLSPLSGVLAAMEHQMPNQHHESFYVHSAVVTDLVQFLDESVPYVWLLGHMPNPAIQWWDTFVPINRETSFSGKIRNIVYDLQMSTAEFIKISPSLNNYGLLLIQSSKPMPDTLELNRIPENQQAPVLKKNGATLKIFLPHAAETAMVTSYCEGRINYDGG